MRNPAAIVLASALATSACSGVVVKECNAIHDREKEYGDAAIAALDRCLNKNTTSMECKNAMDIVDRYTHFATESKKCAEAHRLTGNLLHTKFQLGMVNEKLRDLEKHARLERNVTRK